MAFFGIADIIREKLARFTTAQTTAGATGVAGFSSAGVMSGLSGATVLTKSGTSTTFPGPVSSPGDGNFAFRATNNSGFAAYSEVSLFSWLNGNGLFLRSTGVVAWAGGGTADGAVSLALHRGSPGILEQRNGAAAQAIRIYNRWTDASNGEWFQVGAQITPDVFTIGPRANGTGTVRPVTAVGDWAFEKSGNAAATVRTINTSAGSAAQADFRAVNNIGSFFSLGIYSTTTTPYGAILANSSFNYSSASGGIAILADNAAGSIRFASGGAAEVARFDAAGRFGIGQASPTAFIHIKAGTATAGTAPLKFTPGTNLTTPENGAFEFDGTNLYFTVAGTRRTVNLL